MPAIKQQRAEVAEALLRLGIPAADISARWRLAIAQIPWQRQVGPSCGLAALRMVRDHFLLRGSDEEGGRAAADTAAAATPAPASAPARPVRLTGTKWGMTTRLVGTGPIAVTRVKPGGEAAAAGIKPGELIIAANGTSVANDRDAVVAVLRTGGDAELVVEEPPARPSAIASSGGRLGVGGVACESLLAAAVGRGFSVDGEVFDAAHLATLATDVCGLDARVLPFAALGPAELARAVLDGAMVIMPYDAHSGTKLPVELNGVGAHYGVVVGVCADCGDEAAGLAVPALAEGLAAEGAPPPDSDPAAVEPGRLDPDTLQTALDPAQVAVVVQHSNSARLAIDWYTSWAASNRQLTSFDATKFAAVKSINLADRAVIITGLRK